MQPTLLSGDQHLCFPNSCYCEQCTSEYCSCMFTLLSIFLNINLRNGIWGSKHISVQFSSVPQSCPTLCDPMNRSTPGLPVHHQLSESTQTHVHRVSDAIQPSHPLSSPSSFAFNLSQHQGLHIRWPKYWSFSFNISPSNGHPGLISFRMDWLDHLALKGLSRVFSNTTVLKHQFFGAQLSS